MPGWRSAAGWWSTSPRSTAWPSAHETLKKLAGEVQVWNVLIARGIEQMDRVRFEAVNPTLSPGRDQDGRGGRLSVLLGRRCSDTMNSMPALDPVPSTASASAAPARGFFLVLDGPDGGGKTTQAARLAGWLRGAGPRGRHLPRPRRNPGGRTAPRDPARPQDGRAWRSGPRCCCTWPAGRNWSRR